LKENTPVNIVFSFEVCPFVKPTDITYLGPIKNLMSKTSLAKLAQNPTASTATVQKLPKKEHINIGNKTLRKGF
jgi:hypothetical protein